MDRAFSTTLGGNITSNNDPGATDGAQLTALQPILERKREIVPRQVKNGAKSFVVQQLLHTPP